MVRKSVNLLPAFFRTDKNSKFLSSTIDQFTQTPELERLDGFIGSKLSKNYNPAIDQYITDPQPLRTKYQLEPGLIIKELDGAIKHAYGYDDLINQVAFQGGNTDNLDRLFRPDFYSYDPHINWDMLVNFRDYYWLPTGPNAIKIVGTQREVTSTFTITDSTAGDYFIFSPDGLTPDPQIILYRGVTYIFNVNSVNKLYIKTTSSEGSADLYSAGVTNNGASAGQIIFTVTEHTPTVLYYATDSNTVAGGQFVIKTIEENSYIDVEKEIIGKFQYKSGTGIEFINGLKVRFGGDVKPAAYRDKDYIVEGVGDSIVLVEYNTLATPESIATQYDADFDAENFDTFPFDNFKNIPLTPSYIVINRASKDLNPWTRYNRWFHADVIRALDPLALLPISSRAQRPIIEFKPDLQLFNFGKKAIANVDLIDTTTTDVFSNFEGSPGFWVDNIEVEEGFRVIFNADLDPLVRGRIYEVTFVHIDGESRVNLVETDDNIPFTDASVVVTRGINYAGSSWRFTPSGHWVVAQSKTSLNQAPVFDIFDANGYSYGSTPYTSDFRGTKLFGYAIGTGANDTVLGFPLKYKSVGIESSYLFSNYFNVDVINRVFPDISIQNQVSEGFLKSNKDLTTPAYLNIWTDAADYNIPVIQFQEVFDATTQIEVTTFDRPGYISDIKIDVYLNDIKYKDFSLTKQNEQLFVTFNTTLPASTSGNRIRFDIYSQTSPNLTGYYQAPINLTNNPLNGPVAELTFSELYDHVNTMADRDPKFVGVFPGTNNLKKLPLISKYGTRIIANKNSLAMPHYFLSNKSHNVIEAVKKISDDYGQFKLNLIKTISTVEDYSNIPAALDLVLTQLNENKITVFPYFLSDMVPYGTNKKTRTYTVTDSRNLDYSITSIFDPTALSNRAVLVYLNGRQLLVNREYYFQQYDPTVTLTVSVTKGDVIIIEEYNNTDGSYIPPTPTKLGLYPKFEPQIYLDTSYASGPKNVIQGHDGSLLIAFNDYRDDLILEYETRIFNNLKTAYKADLFDINSVLPGVFRTEEYAYSDIYKFVQKLFLKWTGFYGVDYERNTTYDVDNHKTYNFKSVTDYEFNKSLPGSWRAIYKYYFDTDRPGTHPWEMLGITVKPTWWDNHYGPAPYTAGNLTMWQDLEAGRTAQGSTAGINKLYSRPGLSKIIPVDDSGNMVDPRNWAGIAQNESLIDTDQSWSFGDWGPTENAWRRSSHWPFAMQIIAALAKPADYTAKLFDTSRISINSAGQYSYGTANNFVSPAVLALHSDTIDQQTVRAAGYSVYVIEHGKTKSTGYVNTLKQDLTLGNFNLFSKLGGFVSKDKLSIIIDAVQLGSQNPTPYLPNEDYTVHFNTSNPIKTIGISGVIVIKSNGKFIIRGYDKQDLFFKVFTPVHQLFDSALVVGEKSEDYVTWTANKYYSAGQIVLYSGTYYRTLSNHKSLDTFDKKYYQLLAVLPTTGGVRVLTATKFETAETVIPYGTEYSTLQDVYDFLMGYSKWLTDQGFVFNEYSQDFSETLNWTFSAKEFIYWTTQNWANNSVITLSPFANQLKFQFQEGVVDNIFDSFYEYSLLRADGVAFPDKNFSLIRDGDTFTIKTKNTYEGLFFARLNVVQKEHVLIFNNTTIFNDVLYDIDTGYRQLRVKLKGFRTSAWNGDFVSPGFVYDGASVQVWTAYADYLPGDLVEYVGKYYSAKKKITGTQTFDFTQWIALADRPIAQLLPNFEYKINQFEDFYSLDIDNFDLAQQKLAQHLIGYSPRSYLENIFDNPISQYKFYQGFIKEKGTRNTLLKLEKASTANLQGKVEFSEEWAFRLGYFGGYSSYNELEVPMRESEFVENGQILELVDNLPSPRSPQHSYILSTDLTIKPDNYVSTSAFVTVNSNFDPAEFVLPYAGYPRLDDVQYTFPSLNELLAVTDTSVFTNGDKFWIGFLPDSSWNVFRYTRHLRFITGVESVSTGLTFTTNKPHYLVPGELIAVAHMDTSVDGVYVISEVTTPTSFSVKKEVGNTPSTLPDGQLYAFKSVRFSNIDDIANFPPVADITSDEIFWVDDNGSGKWSALKKVNNYDYTEKSAPRNKPHQQYGYRIAMQTTTGTMVVSANQYYDITGGYGRIYVYDNTFGSQSPVINYSLNSTIDEYRNTTDRAGFGDTLFYDETDDLVFVAAPDASSVRSGGAGYIQQAKETYPGNNYSKAGLVKVSGIFRGTVKSEIQYITLTDPRPENKSNFGSGIHVQRTAANKRVLIGAPGSTSPYAINTGTGVVYRYNLNITPGLREFTSVAGTNPQGSNALFDISITDRTYSVLIHGSNVGTLYNTSTYNNSIITIPGTSLGGTTPHNDLFIQILSTGTNGTIANFIVVPSSKAATHSFTMTTSSRVCLPLDSDGLNMPTVNTKARFGQSVVGDKDAQIVAVSAPGFNSETGAVFVYNFNTATDSYKWSQTISSVNNEYTGILKPGDKLGTSVAMSEDGNYLFVGSEFITDPYLNPGQVFVYKLVAGQYTFVQTLKNPSANDYMYYGHAISVNSTGNKLAVTGLGSNYFANVTFDKGQTTFDEKSARFGETTRLAGSVFVYDRYNEKFLLSQELYDNTVDAGSFYGESVIATDNNVYVGSPNSIVSNNPNGSVYLWKEISANQNSWELYREQTDLVNVNLVKKSYTFNSVDQEVVDYLDIIDPIKGKIPGLADQEIRYKTPFDPATYNVGTAGVVTDGTDYWTSNQVGDLWWDLSTAKYVWYEQGDLSYRKATWGKLFPGSTIDVYEWVASEYTPSQWAALADTNAGLTIGISGKPKNADNTVYSSKQIYDKNTNQLSTVYYYWVKNKTVVPNVLDRKISSYEVASILADPKAYGLKYLSVISANSLFLTNFRDSLVSNNIFLNIGFDTIDSEINKHTEWVLVQENNENGHPPKAIETKMIDSLLGKDALGQVVPDPMLPSRSKYGIEIRPRQSMFVNRYETLRTLLEYTNSVLKDLLVTGFIDFTTLNSKEAIPDVILGEYDKIYEDIEGRDSLVTTLFKRAVITCTVVNGKLQEVKVIDPGYGYINPPTVSILNDLSGAVIKTYIDPITGSVTDAGIINPGRGFVTAPTLLVRGFTVIVQVDPDFNSKWSKYEWSDNSWVRIHTQKYDTTKYWEYVDWSDASYNELKLLTSTVDEVYEVHSLDLVANDYVKVKNPGDGLYLILRKTEAGVAGTFDANFDLIYKEKGTIQILSSVYDTVTAQLGFDNVTTFDQLVYDQTAEIELRNIIKSIRDDIFSGPRRIYWNKLFFKAVKYSLTEQRFLDWAFKTSFVNVRNIAGVLDQRTTYRFQNPSWYEDYFKEIKPYHTNIRNYQLNYQVGESATTPWESSYSYTTDFDLPAIYDKTTNAFSTVTQSSSLINTYPYKGWNDNYTFEIESITLSSQGSGYRAIPKVDIITASGDTGSGATARAYVSFGKVTSIEITNAGSGYKQTPSVVISGGGDTALTPAVAYANLSNKRVRSNKIAIKFDRITARREVESKDVYYTTSTNGSSYTYDLPWYASTDKNTITAKLDGIFILDPNYSIKNYTVVDGIHKKRSQLVLDSVPAKGQKLEIWYTKNIELYSAAERIQDYYNPTSGMLGKELGQLMEGVDYPGLTLDTQPFSYSANWDRMPFGENSWDDDVAGLADIDSVVDGGNLAYTTAMGVKPSDIIIDGDGFVTPYTSHAPEEMIPGQVQESVSISVFTRSSQGSPVIVTQSSFINSTATTTIIDLRLQPANTASVMISYNGRGLVYGKDFTVNFVNKTVTVNTQTITGSAAITVVGIGGSELLGSKTITVSSTSTTVINAPSTFEEIGSIYVTANGVTLAPTTNGSLGYNLTPTSTRDRKAKLTITGLNGETTIVQAWFFRPTYKAYSEVKEQIVTVGTTATSFALIQPPGVLGPVHAQAVVELNGLRLTPPDTTYYQITDNQLVFDIRPDETNPPGIFDASQLEVYVNGLRIRLNQDFLLDQPANRIVFNPGFLAAGDVLAITSLLLADYIIQDGSIILSNAAQSGDLLKVVTYTNADASNIRTEVFKATGSRLYRMERAMLNSSYVWVSINGRPLVNALDYAILEDMQTIQVDKRYRYNIGDKVVVTSFSDTTASKTIGYRIFKDMLGRTHYKRYSDANTCYLSSDLHITDEEISVTNANVLPTPLISQNVPGIIFIDGERIEYFSKQGNVLGKIKRGTLGTSPREFVAAGAAVVDQGRTQTIPSTEQLLYSNVFTTTNTTTYLLSGISSATTANELEVVYAGQLLNKSTSTVHNRALAYDSSTATDVQIAPDFTIVNNGTSTYLVLRSDIAVADKRLTVAKRGARVWYDQGTSLLQSNTVQAQFLLEKSSDLPDKFLYQSVNMNRLYANK